MLSALGAPPPLRRVLLVAAALVLAAGTLSRASAQQVATSVFTGADPVQAGLPVTAEPDTTTPTAAEPAAGTAAEPTAAAAGAAAEPPAAAPAAEPSVGNDAAAVMMPVPTSADPQATHEAAGTAITSAGKLTGASVGASVYARYSLEDASIPLFEMDRVRLNAKLVPAPWLTAVVELDALNVPNVKDAFVRAKASRHFGVTAGQFKKPFGLIELTSTQQLPLVSRGIVDKRIVRELGLGGRDLGLQLQGAMGRLGYAIGGFNGTTDSSDGTALGDRQHGGNDSAARLEWSAAAQVKLGFSAALHGQGDSAGTTSRTWGTGLDARLRAGPFRVRAEALWAEQPLADRRRRTAGGIVYSYTRVAMSSGLTLEPVAKGELVDDDLQHGNDYAWSALAGCNLHLTDSLRVLLQAQQIWAGPSSITRPSRQLFVELTFDYDLRLRGGANASAP